jgi:hypothetical protein
MLENILEDLNDWLTKNNRRITLHVIGGYALELKQIRQGIQTEDIDSVLEISESEVVDQIHILGEKHGNLNWFDFGATTLIVPLGYETRLEEKNNYSNIDLFVLSNIDLIKMKVAAYHSRRERGIYRDLEDLIKLNPSIENIKEAIEFCYVEYSKELPEKFAKVFKEELNELRSELIKVCCK